MHMLSLVNFDITCHHKNSTGNIHIRYPLPHKHTIIKTRAILHPCYEQLPAKVTIHIRVPSGNIITSLKEEAALDSFDKVHQ